MINQVLRREEFQEKPPVLVDIGASGGVYPEWKRIKHFSVCIAFDADVRELSEAEKESSDFRQLHLVKALVTETNRKRVKFHLTSSPYCSSMLEPDGDSLRQWAFADLFHVDKTVELKSATLLQVLKQLGIQYVDWFKTDSQGIDLRLFESLGPGIKRNVLAVDFEPGIIDAYHGEDKMHKVLEKMGGRDFWMTDFRIDGSQRLNRELVNAHLSSKLSRNIQRLLPTAPGWGELSYLNTLVNPNLQNGRSYLLSWVFATIQRQHGFALEVAVKGEKKFRDGLFRKLQSDSVSRIRSAFWKLPFYTVKQYVDKVVRKLDEAVL